MKTLEQDSKELLNDIEIFLKEKEEINESEGKSAHELLKAEIPLVRQIEKELNHNGYKKGTEEYTKMFNSSFHRKFGSSHSVKEDADGLDEASVNKFPPMKGLGLHLNKYPSGKYGFVGSVPFELGYDVDHLSHEQYEKFRKDHNTSPGIAKQLHKVSSRVFNSPEEAKEFATKRGHIIKEDAQLTPKEIFVHVTKTPYMNKEDSEDAVDVIRKHDAEHYDGYPEDDEHVFKVPFHKTRSFIEKMNALGHKCEYDKDFNKKKQLRKESMEILDELKASTLGSYRYKSLNKIKEIAKGFTDDKFNYTPAEVDKKYEKYVSMSKSRKAANDKLVKGDYQKEDVDLTEAKKSVAYHVWKAAFDNPYVVKATKGNVSNEIISKHASLEDAKVEADKYPDGKVFHNVSGKLEYDKSVKEEVETLDELKRSTLIKYKHKALIDALEKAEESGRQLQNHSSNSAKLHFKSQRRGIGVETATDKLLSGKYNKEEVETLDELKRSTLIKYKHKARKSNVEIGNLLSKIDKTKSGSSKLADVIKRKYSKRVQGFDDASHKLNTNNFDEYKKRTNEDVEFFIENKEPERYGYKNTGHAESWVGKAVANRDPKISPKGYAVFIRPKGSLVNENPKVHEKKEDALKHLERVNKVWSNYQSPSKKKTNEDVDMGQYDAVKSDKKEDRKYCVKNKSGEVVSKHDNQSGAIRASLRNNEYSVHPIKEELKKDDYVKQTSDGYGHKTHGKRDIYVDGNYVCSTNWARSHKEAKEKYLKSYPEHSGKKIFIKLDK